jgi:hypothetical protein
MNGRIEFENLQELGEFLKYFTGSTAAFNVYKRGYKWVLEFTGGY